MPELDTTGLLRRYVRTGDPLFRAAADTIDALCAERDELRRIIAEAPHAAYCPQYDGYPEAPCRCFKSRIEETR